MQKALCELVIHRILYAIIKYQFIFVTNEQTLIRKTFYKYKGNI